MNKFVDFLVTAKGYSQKKAFNTLEELNRIDAVDPVRANDYLEDALRHSEMITILKEYILTENYQFPKIRISKEDFETHFHIIDSKGRGRKPKDYIDNGED